MTFTYLPQLSSLLQWSYPGLCPAGLPYFQIPNSSVELSHSLPVAQLPSFCCSCASSPASPSSYGPLAPFFFSSVSAPSLQCLSCKTSLGHTLPRPSAPFSLGLSLCSPCRYPTMDPASHLHFLRLSIMDCKRKAYTQADRLLPIKDF